MSAENSPTPRPTQVGIVSPPSLVEKLAPHYAPRPTEVDAEPEVVAEIILKEGVTSIETPPVAAESGETVEGFSAEDCLVGLSTRLREKVGTGSSVLIIGQERMLAYATGLESALARLRSEPSEAQESEHPPEPAATVERRVAGLEEKTASAIALLNEVAITSLQHTAALRGLADPFPLVTEMERELDAEEEAQPGIAGNSAPGWPSSQPTTNASQISSSEPATTEREPDGWVEADWLEQWRRGRTLSTEGPRITRSRVDDLDNDNIPVYIGSPPPGRVDGATLSDAYQQGYAKCMAEWKAHDATTRAETLDAVREAFGAEDWFGLTPSALWRRIEAILDRLATEGGGS